MINFFIMYSYFLQHSKTSLNKSIILQQIGFSYFQSEKSEVVYNKTTNCQFYCKINTIFIYEQKMAGN